MVGDSLVCDRRIASMRRGRNSDVLITFVLLASYWAKIKDIKRSPKHRHSIADVFFQLGISVSIGDGSPKHRINIADVYPSMLGTLSMCRGMCEVFYFQYMH